MMTLKVRTNEARIACRMMLSEKHKQTHTHEHTHTHSQGHVGAYVCECVWHVRAC